MNEKIFLHDQIYNDLKQKIADKHYPENSLLPKEVDFCDIYQVSRHTIRKAMDRLNNEGFIRKVKGTGTFVNEVKADYSLSNMASFSEILTNQSGDPNSIVLSAKLMEVDDFYCNKLNLQTESKIYVIERLRRNGDVNLCYEKTYVNPNYCPKIDMYVSPNTSLYDLYENRYSLQLKEGYYQLEATNATKKISNLLDIPINSSVLFMRALIKLIDNSPLYYVEAHYVGSRYVFSTNLKR